MLMIFDRTATVILIKQNNLYTLNFFFLIIISHFSVIVLDSNKIITKKYDFYYRTIDTMKSLYSITANVIYSAIIDFRSLLLTKHMI